MGLEEIDVDAGMHLWADGQVRIGSMIPVQRDFVDAYLEVRPARGEGR